MTDPRVGPWPTDSGAAVLVLGDVHGEDGWFRKAARTAASKGCATILQVGDFGFWEHIGSGKQFLDYVELALVKNDLQCVWIDGNHENHTLLRERYVVPERRTPEGFYEVRPHLFYAPRGTRWTWAGTTFLAIGGAYSIDKSRRSPHVSWWPEETITDDEVALCAAGGQVDVVVAHDAPWGAEGVMGAGTVGMKDDWPESAENRRRLRQVVDAVRPKLLVHGHYHHRNSTVLGLPRDGSDDCMEWDAVRVEGLGRDGDPASVMVLDLPLAETSATAAQPGAVATEGDAS